MDFLEVLKAVFISGGWLLIVYVIFRILLMIIRKTKTKKDDEIIDNYVIKAVRLALQVIPKPEETQVVWVKFVGNVLAEFERAYIKEQGDAPDATTYEKAKKLIYEIADHSQFRTAQELIDRYNAPKKN